MIDSRENAQAVVDLLRSMLRADPAATKALFGHRVACNQALVDHPTIICGGEYGSGPDVGFLGVLNGLFDSRWRVASIVDEDTGDLMGFKVVDVSGDGRVG